MMVICAKKGGMVKAGLAVGIWRALEEIESLRRPREHFEPQMSVEERAARAMDWKTAIARVTLGAN